MKDKRKSNLKSGSFLLWDTAMAGHLGVPAGRDPLGTGLSLSGNRK